MRREFIFVMVVLAIALGVIGANAQHTAHVAGGFHYANLGDCAEPLDTLTAEYTGTHYDVEVNGNVRRAPSAADCTEDSRSYNINAERHFDVGALDVSVEVGVDSQSAMYRYVDAKDIPKITEGYEPLYKLYLPVGTVQTNTAVVGVSREVRGARVGVGLNLAGVNWNNDPGKTARFSGSFDVGPVTFDASADVGSGALNGVYTADLSARYRLAVGERFNINFGVDHYRGLDNIVPSGEKPGSQMFLDQWPVEPFPGATPRAHATYVSVTVGYSLF